MSYDTEDIDVRSKYDSEDINVRSSAAGFSLREVIPPALEAAARCGRRRYYGAGLRQLQGMGPKRFVLSVDNDNEFRTQCV